MLPDTRALRALARRDPRLGAAMRRLAPFPGFPTGVLARGTHFHALARAIVYQQLATRAAAAIHARVCALAKGSGFPSPSELLALPMASLRAAGLSQSKALALHELAARFESGELRHRSLGRLGDEEVIERLVAVRGIGVWSAQMFLIFRLGRLDVMPAGDLGVREGVRWLDDLAERPTPGEVLARSERWRPLRSVASWTLWRLVEEVRQADAPRAPRGTRPRRGTRA
jgi:DNA-3-methyladenine glycosylase II